MTDLLIPETIAGGAFDPGLAFRLAADLLDPPPDPTENALRPYLYDPVGWVREFLPECELTDYQEEILVALVKHRKVSVRGPHGLGKTTEASVGVLWFATTRDACGMDWKVVTTASVWRQLTKYLWPEIHKWARKIRWDKLGRAPFGRNELIKLNLQLKYGTAFAAASDIPENIEGAHADHLLYIIDEGKTVIAASYNAIEGAFSGSSPTGTTVAPSESYALAISTPGEPAGRFYEIHARRPGFEDWWVRHVTLAEAIKGGRISEEWTEQRARQWGVNSALYQNRVLGQFAVDEVDGLIPNAWVEQAMQRWTPYMPKDKAGEKVKLSCLGVDVARFGNDKTLFAARYGFWWSELEGVQGADTMEVTGRVVEIMRNAGALNQGSKAYACIDVIGVGAGVVDRAREEGLDVEAFNASSSAQDETDVTGELIFLNRRASAWWAMRDALNPANNFNIALPPDDELLGDLCSPRYRRTSGGKIRVEEKDEIRKRLGRSPDRGDAVVMSLANRQLEPTSGFLVYDDYQEVSPY